MYGYATLLLIASLVAQGTAVTHYLPESFLQNFQSCAVSFLLVYFQLQTNNTQRDCEVASYELEYNTTDTAYNWCSTYSFANDTACCIRDECEVQDPSCTLSPFRPKLFTFPY